MQLITAIIQPSKLEDVRDAIVMAGAEGATCIEVRGFGRQRGQTDIYPGSEYAIDWLPKVKIEVAVSDDLKDAVVTAIQRAANTGTIGDGKIFVLPIGEAIRIRTGETGDAALHDQTIE